MSDAKIKLSSPDNDEQPQNWYFTFGFGHEYPNGYIKIFGTCAETRNKMFQRFGAKWSFQYPECAFLPQIERYNLHEVILN